MSRRKSHDQKKKKELAKSSEVTEATAPRMPPPSPATPPAMRSRRLLALPLAFIVALAAFLALPSVWQDEGLRWSFGGVAALLLVWNGLLFAASRKRTIGVSFVVRRPHWLQPLVQLTIYVYWGWHWRQVYDSAHFIVAQLLFAYAFDMLLAWSRRDSYELGFGPFPIIFSMNLFMWFKPEWFYLQFAMVATGFAAKELLRWTKDGRRAHIFNPSSFPLAIVSIALLASGATDHTWGKQIATTLERPLHIYDLLFLISIPGQFLFGVASMTMPAVVTTFLLSALYFAVTGSYYFFGPIPTAAFLGMLLLFTDPATAPKSELGRILFGILYGASVFVLYGLLESTGQPTFYDKLLFVPFLNLSVRAIDRLAAWKGLARLDVAALGKSLTPRGRNVAYMAVWAVVFLGIRFAHGVSDTHPANRLPFWQSACAAGRRNACKNVETMVGTFCERGSGWACNELGILASERRLHADQDQGLIQASSFERACGLGFEAGCWNLQYARMAGGAPPRHAPPRPADYDRLLENKGLPTERTTSQLVEFACEQGWQEACAQHGG
jgi:hypothetical protein